ncbi:Campylobacter invasion antigen B (CiaB) [hydrothermal vent metagenome]|uniref:Campylobacter invasion antigen B (CiaB) n=1 Tax=hydrothermal vent metagenome TaxID=652676 RepID=A0A3B1DUK2_9ZZZZ
MKQQFINDIQKLDNYISKQKDKVNQLYVYLENEEFNKLIIIDQFISHLGLNMSNDLRVALVARLVNLRDDSFIQVLKKLKKSDDDIIQLQEKAYKFVATYWLEIHKNTVHYIEKEKLFTPFYRAIFKGVYEVGLKMTVWQTAWTALIINGVNKDLLQKFDGNNSKIMEYLEKNKLFDLGHNKRVADRSYSVLIKTNKKYESQAYIKAFKNEVLDVIDVLESFVDNIMGLEDKVYNQKWAYILYLQSLIGAFVEKRPNELVTKWAQVDRAWMKITTPIQIGHPLEYYEDHFRKAVALEWDLRLTNPTLQNNNLRVDKLKSMFSKIYKDIDTKKQYKSIYDFSLKSLDKVQLYLGRPALFFGAEFNGLFSAQVVPNDEIVSHKEGKKIFAFSDDILQVQRAKPFLKLSREILGQDFLTEDRTVLFDDRDNNKWHKVYDITTIGHEYGHILWCDENTEVVMNKGGNFKNIEEFKATAGGLVSFFNDLCNNESDCAREVLFDTIKRAVGLIGWMEINEVQPYYCEGLIHLSGLFSSEVLSWDEKVKQLTIKLDNKTIQTLKHWYITTYSSLALHYLEKKEATDWLNIYATKVDKYFMPVNNDIKTFVKYYFARYKAIGQELDTQDTKDNY